jgi:hypothetical protein
MDNWFITRSIQPIDILGGSSPTHRIQLTTITIVPIRGLSHDIRVHIYILLHIYIYLNTYDYIQL